MIQMQPAGTVAPEKCASLDFPWPVSLNSMWRVYNQRLILSAEARLWRVNGLAQLREARYTQMRRDWPYVGRLSVVIVIYPPTRRRIDVDNFAKGIFDLLTHAGVWDDDSQIDELTIRRGAVTKGGRSTVHIYPMEEK